MAVFVGNKHFKPLMLCLEKAGFFSKKLLARLSSMYLPTKRIIKNNGYSHLVNITIHLTQQIMEQRPLPVIKGQVSALTMR